MQALGTTLIWVCMLIVALPLSPCAFVSVGCCPYNATAEEESVAAADCTAADASDVPPCCAHHQAPTGQAPVKQGDRSCKTDCCRLSPFVPSLAKVLLDAQPLVLAHSVPQRVALPAGWLALPSSTLIEAVPLRILHCQWRC